ncbi:MAG: class I SAM-dependent methyltransferase [Planctomycetes bacterium]|nr:class I SAM-dependent methyltransferase [Planctomycetota bacterium]
MVRGRSRPTPDSPLRRHSGRPGEEPAYHYPDRDDRVVLTDADGKWPYPQYWDRSERYALHLVESFLAAGSYASLLDGGGGKGRLLPTFAGYFRAVVGLEPDAERAAHARRVVEQRNLAHAEILHGDLAALESRADRFNVALCCHVLQHVPSQDVASILDAIHALLNVDGLLILFAPRSRQSTDRFVANHLAQGRVVSTSVDEREFNRLIVNDDGILPVRLFSEAQLEGLVRTRFVVLKRWTYRERGPATLFDRFILRDRVFNLPLLRRHFGENLVLVARKPGPRRR